MSREPQTERLEPVELASIAAAAAAEPVIKSRALAETARMKPVETARLARGSATVPKQPVPQPRGPRRKREKLAVDQILTRKTS